MPRKCCLWSEDSDGVWETSCNQMFDLTDGTPVENRFKFCPYCGLKLTEQPFEEEEE